jgi:MFS family permease
VTASAARLGLTALSLIGVAQICAWGSVYYTFSLTGPLIARDLGLSNALVTGGFTLALAVGALISAPVGAALDRFGGRPMLAAGSIAGAAAMAATGAAQGLVSYVFASVLLGLAAAMALYDAIFPALVQAAGAGARRAITIVTLFGGFASTAFWPLTSALLTALDWRQVYFLYAGVHLAFCLPVYLFALPGAPATIDASTANAVMAEPAPLQGEARRRAFVLFGVLLAVFNLVSAGLTVLMIQILTDFGHAPGAAVFAAALFGPAQVAGRVWEMATQAKVSALGVGRVASLLLPVALALLVGATVSYAAALGFAIVFGLSNGLMTIAKGTMALALFGRGGYGAMLGRLSVASLLFRAFGPFVFAALSGSGGAAAMIGVMAACALAGVIACEKLARLARPVEKTHNSAA